MVKGKIKREGNDSFLFSALPNIFQTRFLNLRTKRFVLNILFSKPFFSIILDCNLNLSKQFTQNMNIIYNQRL